jgi:cytochrome b subunit of formate dehydrogenase
MTVIPVLQTVSTTVSRLPAVYAWAILLVFAAALTVHFVRRSYHQPVRTGGTPVDVPGDSVKAFDLVERLFHWSLFIILGLLVVSGIALFIPGSFNYILGAFGVAGTSGAAEQANLLWHTDMVWLLLGLIVIHIVWDLGVDRGWSEQVVRKYDFSDSTTRVKSFLGFGPKVQPRHGKYDIFMKSFHWGLAGSIVILGVTGIYLWNPYALFPTLSPGFEFTMRWIHDLFAFLLVGLIAMHIYFAVVPVNWPVLRSMITGTISGEAYNHDYDSTRWPLKKKKEPAAVAPAPVSTPAAAPAMATSTEGTGDNNIAPAVDPDESADDDGIE